ncbi:HAD family hydrolase [Nocardia salmonicida]|uniref:HAD family hydrolase n=1 Tax=Nocardia salmonicida TaxID=53431 RepID=UPI0034059289
MTLPRLMATDLDGTLLRADGTVSQRTLDTLRTAIGAGVEIVVVTARPPRCLDALVAAAGLTGTAVEGVGVAVETGHRVFFEPGYRPRLTRHTGAESPVRALADLWTLDVPIVKLLAYSAPGARWATPHSSVRAAVARHTASNEEDGVAVVIERLFESCSRAPADTRSDVGV